MTKGNVTNLLTYHLLPGPGNQAAGRFLILSYFYSFLILRFEQVAGKYCVARQQVADSRRCIYVRAYAYVHLYACSDKMVRTGAGFVR